MSGSAFRPQTATDHPLTTAPAIMPFAVFVGSWPVVERLSTGRSVYMLYRTRAGAEAGASRARSGGLAEARAVDRREPAK